MNRFSIIVTLLANLSFTQLAANAAHLPPARNSHGMVVTSQNLATQAGRRILNQGGNAMDAAVAIGYTLAVVHPCCGNLGGGGFMLYRPHNGSAKFINFRENAPAGIKPEMFLDSEGQKRPESMRYGYLPVGVPGTVKGLNYALRRYGTMTRQQVMGPAIHYASNGFKLQPQDVNLLNKFVPYFRRSDGASRIFLNKGQPYQVGEILKQPQLAHSLKLIAQKGSRVFYQGRIGQALVRSIQQNGGVLSMDDLNRYQIEDRQPVQCQYRGYWIYSAALPSSGGITLCESLGILARFPINYLGFHSSQSVHYITEAERFAFADRNANLGDPDYVNDPAKGLLSKSHIQSIVDRIQPYRATPSESLEKALIHQNGGPHTTHYSVVDKQGNAVSVTYTLNSWFGAKVVAGDTGILLNNELSDFVIKPGMKNIYGLVEGKANALAPNKQPLSSMAPTIVTRDNKLALVLGAPRRLNHYHQCLTSFD